jgi:hypothetical protein
MRLTVVPAFRALTLAAAAAAALGFAPQTAASRFALAEVLDPRGHTLVDVGADDFVVEESGTTREVLSVRVADYPVVVVVDNGLAAHGDFPLIQKAAARFIERLGPRPVAIVAAGGPPKVVATFDDDRSAVSERLRTMSTTVANGLPLQGVALAARTIRESGTLFSTIVVLTASQLETESAIVDEAFGSVIDSHAVLHVVTRSLRRPGSDSLRNLVGQSRGEFNAIYSPASYQPALDRLTDRMNTELLIEYIVPVASQPVDVRIGVRLPGARVRGLGVAPR